MEHHIAVYKGKNGKIAKAEHLKELLQNSVATASLVASIMNTKYTNGVPLYRIEQEYERCDIRLSRQTMSHWMVTTAERYLSLVYEILKEEITKCEVIHADETPVAVAKDGRDGMHNSYMWVYRNGGLKDNHNAVIYDFRTTRKKDAAKEFLKDFRGILVCDGYQVYHSLEKDDDTSFKVAGCWAHAKRRFSEIIKQLGDVAILKVDTSR